MFLWITLFFNYTSFLSLLGVMCISYRGEPWVQWMFHSQVPEDHSVSDLGGIFVSYFPPEVITVPFFPNS